MSQEQQEQIRLQKYLASCGLGSRRSCESLISSGRVTVNGDPVSELGSKVSLADEIRVDGRIVSQVRQLYFMLNKPVGYICSNADRHHELFARDLIEVEHKSSLFHVGRLDKDSSGLILYTNDGELAQKISHPSYQMEKEYLVRLDKPVRTPAALCRKILSGVKTPEGIYRPVSIRFTSERECVMVLTEGKNREIRNLFSHLGYRVTALKRVRVGRLLLKDLPEGAYRALTAEEIRSLRPKGASR